jgi:hypothetical protein
MSAAAKRNDYPITLLLTALIHRLMEIALLDSPSLAVKNMKLYLCLNENCTMKTYGEVEV